MKTTIDELKMINEFLKSDEVFNEDTPDFIKWNDDCIKASADRDIDILRFLHSIPVRLENYIINKAIEEEYVLHRKSPDFCRRNYDIALNSIKLDVSSADYVDWYSVLNPMYHCLLEESNEPNKRMGTLIEAVVDGGYILHGRSHEVLCKNYAIAKNSISLDVRSADYVYWDYIAKVNQAERVQELIELVNDCEYVLHEDSPRFLRGNYDIAMQSINSKTISADFVDWNEIENSDDTDKKITNLVNVLVRKGYILHEKSPYFLKSNIDIVKNSINQIVLSADYVDWYEMKKLVKDNVIDELIDLVISKGYKLSMSSPTFLRRNVKVCLNSVKSDIYTFRFIDDRALGDHEIFKYLILNGVEFGYFNLKDKTLDNFLDKDILKKSLEQIGSFISNNNLYRDRLSEVVSDALKISPTIKPLEEVFPVMARIHWEEYKKENANYLVNLFSKISSELRNSEEFVMALSNLKFIEDMEKVLGDQYDDFCQAMKEYFDIYHSDAEDKLDKMQPAQDKISYYAALYVAKKKDIYLKQEISEYYRFIKQFFVLRLDNPKVDKKLKQGKKKELFRILFQNNDVTIGGFVNNIVDSFSKELNKDLLLKLVQKFVLEDKAKIEQIIPKPDNYDAYGKYEKVIQLIKRLNLGFIDFNGVEVKNYKDVIGFDEEKGMYVYTGVVFSEEETAEIKDYKKTSEIFEKIKKEITLKINEMDVLVEVDEKTMKMIAEEFPFEDEYFEFDRKNLTRFDIEDLKLSFLEGFLESGFKADGFIDDEAYKLIKRVILQYGVIWLILLPNRIAPFKKSIMHRSDIRKIIDNALNILKLAKELGLQTKTFKDIFFLGEIGSADLITLDILGIDIVEKLCRYTSFTDGDLENIVFMAQRLVAEMAGRSMSTVPYVSGETMNYKYSLYDSQDVDVLLAGINTDACFKVCGNDNDFLHYCCLNKNGFVIKITDKDGNFIGRAAGFRNGNCVFLNQLRTIYDVNGNHYIGKYENETNEIIETLRKACEDIVRTSQENELESKKIDYVFVTKSYSLEKIATCVSTSVRGEIGNHPMEMDGRDWEDFIDFNKLYLHSASYTSAFDTDYGSYPLICMASAKNGETIECRDLRFGTVTAFYERTRNKIIATTNIDSNIIRKIKKIKGIDSRIKEKDYREIMIPEGSTVFVGDNWYCVYADGQIVDSCVLEFDEKARREFELTKAKLDVMAIDLIKKQATSESIDIEDVKKLNKVLTTPNE